MSSDSRHKSRFDGRIGLLKIFAGIINPSEKGEIPLTLNVHGTIVSGLMIGMKPYYKQVRNIFVEAINSSSRKHASVAKEEFKMVFDKIEEPPNSKELVEGVYEFNHIFMRNTKIYNGGQVIPSTGTTYWIGKIESVDGFFIGMIQPLEPDS
jgi:hypothetical protein